MSTNAKSADQSESFTRFRDLTKKLVSVPKEELKKREAEHQKASKTEAKKRRS